jgi:murein DD-endopeptidase MepM/ murein hydrolase activator NlpD
VKSVFLLALLLYLTPGFATSPAAADAGSGSAPTGGSPFPLQLEARVPFAPTAFPSTGRTYVAYELYVTNFSPSPMTLSRVEVLDAQETSSKPVATFEGEQLDALLQPIGTQAPANKSDLRQLNGGATIVAFMWIPFEKGVKVPDRLFHRVVTTDSSSMEGAIISTHQTELHLLAPPVRGDDWMASDGPSNDPTNHHRRGVLILNGQSHISRRFATDWFLYKNVASSSRDPHDLNSYPSYGQPVFAVADATVVKARDGLPNNVPGPVASFHPAVPITMDTVGGNTIVLDLGGGQYAWYFHLKPGSLRVKTGEPVRRGQPLAQIGCSGDPPVPHLHFEVTTSTTLLAGEGVPYLIDHYRVLTPDKVWEAHTRELPLGGTLVDFGPGDSLTSAASAH